MQGCPVDRAPPRANSLLLGQMCQSSWIAMLPHCRLHLFWHRYPLSPNSMKLQKIYLWTDFLGSQVAIARISRRQKRRHQIAAFSTDHLTLWYIKQLPQQLVSRWRGRVRYENLEPLEGLAEEDVEVQLAQWKWFGGEITRCDIVDIINSLTMSLWISRSFYRSMGVSVKRMGINIPQYNGFWCWHYDTAVETSHSCTKIWLKYLCVKD